ncbi:hypothetical protein F4801DRAFT_546872 [Xylaria longipes]|nr:hypothetical protein F4801DRAFT_546872 [Xylaria longipes]RYC57438.1 hypothetical protein CHU98_g8772 [Xylaria longipes]
MQHTPNSSQQFAQRGPGLLYTPTRSFGEAVQISDAQGIEADKQAQEHEVAKSRLSDHKFNIRDYADPLLPRQQPPSHPNPRSVTAETEKHLLELISRLKAGNA